MSTKRSRPAPTETPAGSSYPWLSAPSTSRGRLTAGIGLICGLLLFVTVVPPLSGAVTYLGWLIAGRPGRFAAYAEAGARFEYPAGFLAANLGISTLIPITVVLLIVIHHVPPGWVVSVSGRLRWRYLLLALASAVVVFGGATLVAGLPDGRPAGPDDQLTAFLIIVLISSPLQAAAEEVFFRGYLTQTIGTLTGLPFLGIVAPAVLFALWHGNQNPALLINRLIFGLIAGILVWLTGGLEAVIAGHIANNLASYLPLLATGSTLTPARTLTAISWQATATQTAIYSIFAGIAWLTGRLINIQTRRQPTGSFIA